jgi:rhamnopyranosyl-N-acetylglucosaminyl-diphospho-decaprenol beta-1,3/1,4-galactofuranosyltransferase
MLKNLGGGGGFHFGAKCAYEKGADWIWLMDDDCLPDQNCLKNLMSNIDSDYNVYSPVMLSLEDRKTVLWGLKGEAHTGNKSVCPLPFNGFLIHRKLINKIGYPDKEFFIYGDDTDYSLRVISSGSLLIMVTDSILYHPYRNMIKEFNIIKMFLSKLWVYYKLRNAIIIYKRHNYVSKNQIVMFMSAFLFYIVTLRFDFIKLWIEGFKDGLNSKLYVRDFTT